MAKHKVIKASQVVIDTSVYESIGFNFRTPVISAFEAACDRGELRLLTPSVIARECIIHIKKKAKEAIVNLDKAARVSGDIIPRPKITVDELARQMTDEYLMHQARCCSIGIIPCPTAWTSTLNAHFECRPPFSENKPAEFKDAITLFGIRGFCQRSKFEAYIISYDKDWLKFSEANPHLHYLDSINELLDICNSHNDLSEVLKEYVLNYKLDIFLEIANDCIDKIDFECRGEIADIQFSSIVSVDLKDAYVIELSESNALVSVDATLCAEIEAEYCDYSYATYDKEDGRFYNVGLRNFTSHPDFTATYTFKCSFVDGNLSDIDVEDIDFDVEGKVHYDISEFS